MKQQANKPGLDGAGTTLMLLQRGYVECWWRRAAPGSSRETRPGIERCPSTNRNLGCMVRDKALRSTHSHGRDVVAQAHPTFRLLLNHVPHTSFFTLLSCSHGMASQQPRQAQHLVVPVFGWNRSVYGEQSLPHFLCHQGHRVAALSLVIRGTI
jgi:hypothetical protein